MQKLVVKSIDEKTKDESVSQEELCCPVCEMPLSSPPIINGLHIKATGRQAALMRFNQLSNTKNKDANLVVSAICGHLFHKFCLRHYCCMSKQTGFAGGYDRIECPLCYQKISMTKTHSVDIRSSLSFSPAIEKDCRLALLMNKELCEQKEAADNKLQEITVALKETKTQLQDCREHHAVIGEGLKCMKYLEKTQNTMLDEITECDRAIDMMHKENIQLIKMYLTEMKGKSEEFLREKRIPPALIPYLSVITENEKLLRKFGEILRPVEMDGFKSNTNILIKEILADGPNSKSRNMKQYRTHAVTDLTEHKFQFAKSDERKPVVVKVQRSSLSIFGRTRRNERSLPQIMQHVKDPIKTQRNAHEKIKPKIAEPNHTSDSEIQVLLEPRKMRHTGTYHTPDRLQSRGSKFIDIKSLPPRRCRSTDPVLIKHWKNKDPQKKVFAGDVSLGDSKQDDVLEVAKDQEPVKQLNQLGANEEKVRLSSKDLATKSAHGESTEKLSRNNKKGTKKCRVVRMRRKKHLPKFQVRRFPSTAGFEIKPKGSVLELLFESMSEGEHASTTVCRNSIVGKFGSIKLKESGSDSYPNDTITVCKEEYQQYCHHNRNDSKNEQLLNQYNSVKKTSEGSSGVLSGILPGPYFTNSRINSQSLEASHHSPPIDSLPVYLSKWLRKLPSTYGRCRNASVVEGSSFMERLPPPPPQSSRPYPGAILSPSVQPRRSPVNISTETTNHHPDSSLEDKNCNTSMQRNRPFGDMMTSEITLSPPKNYQSSSFVFSKFFDSNQVKIDIPTSDESTISMYEARSVQKSDGLKISQSQINSQNQRRFDEIDSSLWANGKPTGPRLASFEHTRFFPCNFSYPFCVPNFAPRLVNIYSRPPGCIPKFNPSFQINSCPFQPNFPLPQGHGSFTQPIICPVPLPLPPRTLFTTMPMDPNAQNLPQFPCPDRLLESDPNTHDRNDMMHGDIIAECQDPDPCQADIITNPTVKGIPAEPVIDELYIRNSPCVQQNISKNGNLHLTSRTEVSTKRPTSPSKGKTNTLPNLKNADSNSATLQDSRKKPVERYTSLRAKRRVEEMTSKSQ